VVRIGSLSPPGQPGATLKKERWMVDKLDASKSGSLKIGGDIEINRLGFGAMRLTGPGIWGPPADKAEAIRTLKRVPNLGINFIDTADSYGPDVSEQLIREALYPMTAFLSPPRPDCGDPDPVLGIGMVVRNTCANRQSKAGNGLALSRLDSGSYIASKRYSKWRPCRTGTILSIAAVRT
jgi:hypothetical protein